MKLNTISNLTILSLFFLKNFSVTSCQNSISQISPKSTENIEGIEDKIQPSHTLKEVLFLKTEDKEMLSTRNSNEESTPSKISEIESNNIEILETSGRYSDMILPTFDQDKSTKINSNGFTNMNYFLVQGGRQARSSRPQKQDLNIVMPKLNATSDFAKARQNNDIQGIISGIVKILNGNVNVHANNQGNRRPPSNRINNRGPPRISEAQIPANDNIDINQKQQNSYSDSSLLRPFLTGVPIPEQIVPSMQQNYRPGFVSQNRPPWKRTKPPINRRPVSQYTHHHIPTHLVPDETNSYLNDTFQSNKEEIIDEEISSEDIDPTFINEIQKQSNLTHSIGNPESTVITIIQSKSEVNTFDHNEFDHMVNEIRSNLSLELEPSTSEISSQILLTPTFFETFNPNLASKTTVRLTDELVTSQNFINPSAVSHRESYQTQFIPRPGVVLDDPEFNSGSKTQHSAQRLPSNLPAGYGEIFDVTLSAVQFGDSNVGSHQTINIKPYGVYDGTDIILTPSGDQGFVSIDGKRTYINLFGESTESPLIINSTYASTENQSINPTKVTHPRITGSGYATIAETEPQIKKTQQSQNRLVLKQKPLASLPPVRIDTCIVGDDSTCDRAQNERCRTENGVSSCNCRQGYARRKHRDICRKIVSLIVSIRVDRFNERKITWDSSLNDSSSETHRVLKYESIRAIESAMSMTPFSDEFLEASVNNLYQGDPSKGLAGVFVNLTLMIEENSETLRPSIKNDIQRHLLGVLHRRNNNIGTSALFVDNAAGSISAVVDLNECEGPDLNDCHPDAFCTNIWGSYLCQCNNGMKDLNIDQSQKMGRECLACDPTVCNNRGTCYFENGTPVCTCAGFYYGSTCEIDGEVLFVSIGASVAAIFIIILTLICLIMWSRKWQREHKNAIIGSPLFGLGGYMNNPQIKAPMGTLPYQMTLEDRMRWAQIADVMAQSNHYAAEPSRTIQTIYSGYPNLNGMMGMTLPHSIHRNNLPTTNPPPVPLPRLGINRPNGLRTLENSSSSEEEDRTDLLGRSFQVPRPKSRAASVTSAIYYDVDYSPEQHECGTSTGIPLSTYGSKPSSTSYYK